MNIFDSANDANIKLQQEKRSGIAEKMYISIQAFYKFIVESIDPEDYEMMKETLHYTESYDEHIDSLLQGIPDKQITINHIIEFLTEYNEFASEQYVDVLSTLNERMMANRESCKETAFKILTSHTGDDQTPKENKPAKGETSGKVEAIVGGNIVSFNTYKDPLLVSLYSLLLTWFSIKTYGVPPAPLPDVEQDLDFRDHNFDEDDIPSVD